MHLADRGKVDLDLPMQHWMVAFLGSPKPQGRIGPWPLDRPIFLQVSKIIKRIVRIVPRVLRAIC